MRNLAILLFSLLGLSEVHAESSSALPGMLANYPSWTRFPTIPVSSFVNGLCFVPPIASAFQENEAVEKGPHRDKYLSVYFNAEAATVVRSLRNAMFPMGSIIVKEKKFTKDAPAHALGVMMKDGEAGKWRYLYLNEAGELIQDPKRTQNCATCHERAVKTDYVFGNYAVKRPLLVP